MNLKIKLCDEQFLFTIRAKIKGPKEYETCLLLLFVPLKLSEFQCI